MKGLAAQGLGGLLQWGVEPAEERRGCKHISVIIQIYIDKASQRLRLWPYAVTNRSSFGASPLRPYQAHGPPGPHRLALSGHGGLPAPPAQGRWQMGR